MQQKNISIKNPLTIIAIFAGIAEVSGTVVLPFVSASNQALFIYFLIGFPTFLVFCFFITLNFNNRVLYAPSDYKNEDNYIRVNRFDSNSQKNEIVKISVEEQKLKQLSAIESRLEIMEKRFDIVTQLPHKSSFTQEQEATSSSYYNYLVTDFFNVDDFISNMKLLGVYFKVYDVQRDEFTDNFEENAAIWLGKNIEVEVAKMVITEAKRFYPHLKYIKLSQASEVYEVHNELYIGGSTKSAIEYFRCKEVSDADFLQIKNMQTMEELHAFLIRFRAF